MIVFPHCKINLGLYVTGRRDDGFHNIESIFLPVKTVNDVLEVIHTNDEKFSLTVTGIPIQGSAEDNICFKAWSLLRREKNIPAVQCHLHKIIPTGAGLGGGSADGAFMLSALNELFELNFSKEELKSFALELGSDCPFFIDAQPSFVSGRGELITPLPLRLSGMHVVIVHPGIHVNTAEAYSMIAAKAPAFDLRKTVELDPSLWQEKINNDFEVPVSNKYPLIAGIKNKLINSGVLYSSMSGSGSAVYGLFREEPDIEGMFEGCFMGKGKME